MKTACGNNNFCGWFSQVWVFNTQSKNKIKFIIYSYWWMQKTWVTDISKAEQIKKKIICLKRIWGENKKIRFFLKFEWMNPSYFCLFTVTLAHTLFFFFFCFLFLFLSHCWSPSPWHLLQAALSQCLQHNKTSFFRCIAVQNVQCLT